MAPSRARAAWHDFPTLDTLVRAEDIEKWDQGVYEFKTRQVDVRDYGEGVGAGDASIDTTATQAAATAAVANNAALVLPPSLTLNSTVNLVPASGSQFHMDILSAGPYTQVAWTGSDNTSVFKSYGWKRSQISGAHIRVPSGKTGVVVWDVDHDSTRGSTGLLNWLNCRVTGASTGIVGWRLGHSSGSELSFMNWLGCSVEQDSVLGSSIGWVNEDSNGLVLMWYGCDATFVDKGWTNTSTSGAASAQGGPTMFFYGCGGTGTNTDFDFKNSGVYAIYSGRWELGSRFLNVPAASTMATVTVDGVEVASYAPADGQVFTFSKPGTLELRNLQVTPPSASADFTNEMIRMDTTVSGQATLIVRGGAYRAADPFFRAAGTSQPRVFIEGVKLRNAAGQNTGNVNERHPLETVTSLTYSATIATDAALSRRYTIVATNGTAFTISNPTNALSGRTITYDIKNSSGGAMGVVTWGADFKLDATGFVNPANGKRKTITFYSDGTNWVQVGPTSADI